MRKIQYILLGLVLSISFMFFSSCKKTRLDPFLFNNAKLDSYKLDNYKGEVDFVLDDSYKISSTLVTQFSLFSQTSAESKSTKIEAIYIGDISKIATDTVIMYCHGNKDHMDFYWQRAKLLANTGAKNRFGVLMVDYRGYGMSEGKPTEEGMYADVDAALAWLKTKGLTSNRLVMYGFSLGSAPACNLTANPRSLVPTKLMLEAPFAGAATMVQDASKLSLNSKYIVDVKIDNAEQIKKVQQPFFWIHGEADDFLSIKTHGEVVYANYNGTYKEAHRIPNAGHSTVPQTVGFQSYLKLLELFITTK